VCMRATGQVDSLTGGLDGTEARIVVGRAVLGEWLGGSGGGWQDSGGIFPGIKEIRGEVASPGDPEYGSSRGRLLPRHRILDEVEVPASSRQALQDSLVLVHGGMAANVGPILEMVTEKYLLGDRKAWKARQTLLGAFDPIVQALRCGDMKKLGALTTELFEGPLQAIIPWVSNLFTERLIFETRERYGAAFWGFWMLGGMSGGGMGLIFDPSRKEEAKAWLGPNLRRIKEGLEAGLPFAMEPVVYDFSINDQGTIAEIFQDERGIPSPSYCLQHLRAWLVQGDSLALHQRHELAQFTRRWVDDQSKIAKDVLERLLPGAEPGSAFAGLTSVLDRGGFDPVTHESVRKDLRAGRIGLAQNRLPPDTTIEDARAGDIVKRNDIAMGYATIGEAALREGRVMVLTLAGGASTRWTQGAGTVKALHPFASIDGEYRNFLQVHRAKWRQAGKRFGRTPLQVVTASELTFPAVEPLLRAWNEEEPELPVWISEGRSLGLRMVPMVRDLKFLWEETSLQRLEERKQKVLESGRRALMEWALSSGEGADYRDNLPSQCVHPVGHWYEVANLLLNGTLAKALELRPETEWMLLHNLDTLGAELDPLLLGHAIATERSFCWEVITRRIEDHGGGLARVNGRLRFVEGMAFPREKDEFRLSFYNSATCWIHIDTLLKLFELERGS
ncbi:MAG: UTP--glucose-1-phosphate uridylyltransferase, partial [Rectinemataceae bacterium]